MATRAGVSEYSTSPIAQRRRDRSIRASWTTGYWGAETSIRASISTRFVTTAPTIRRASWPTAGSASTSARSRSSTAGAVRWPKSASNTADRATRRPARNERTRSDLASSATDAVDQDGDGAHLETQKPLDGEPDGLADMASCGDEVGPWPRDDAELDLDPRRLRVDRDRRAGERRPPAWTTASHGQDVGNLERCPANDIDDHIAPDGQLHRR